MKAYLKFFICCAAFFSSKISAQTYLPIASNGYSLDGVAENTTAVSTTGAALDASDFVLYSQYYGTLYSASAVGLPNNGLIASGTRTYQLQGYAGVNVLHLFASGQDSLNFITPQAFPSISLLGFGTQGAASASITIRFTDNTTQVFSTITMDDWFGTTAAAYSGFDRALRTSGVPALVGSAGNPKMFAFDLPIQCANQAKAIKSVKIKNNSASAQICVMAVSGEVPSYSITPNPSSICAGAGINPTLTSTGLSSYSWQAVGNFAGSNASSVVVSPTVTTTYTLLGVNAGCPAYAVTTISVSNGAPNLTVTASAASVCLGGTAAINASGATSYVFTNSLTNGASFTPSATAVYTVVGLNSCTSVSQTVSIAVAPLPVSAGTATLSVCEGAATTLSASGASSYTWLPGNSTQTNYIVSPLASTNYTLLGMYGNCSGSTTLSITTRPVPSLTLSVSNVSICLGNSTNLSIAGNALSYTWSPGNQNTSSINVSPTQLTLYSVVGINSVNCTSTQQQAIFVNPLPNVGVSAVNPTVCSGGSSTLIASGATTYSWNQVSGTATTIVNPVSNTVYTVSGSYATGCSASNTVLISVYLPTIAISANTAICMGTSITISAGTAASYTWNNGLSGQQFVSVSPTLTTLYSVTASVFGPNAIKCPATNSVQVTVNANPTLTITSTKTNSTICKGETLKLTGSGAGSSGTYSWNTGATTATLNANPTSTKSYTISGIDANGCPGYEQYTVKVLPCTGIENYAEHAAGILIYPNPSNGQVTISSEEAIALLVRNELGEVIQKLNLNADNNFSVKIENLAPGIYFVSTDQAQNAFTQKIVIGK